MCFKCTDAMLIGCVLSCLVIFSCSIPGPQHPKPVNPNTSLEARMLLDFLYEIEGEYTLSGHHNYIRNLTQYSGAVEDMTGVSPVVWGADFSFNFGDRDPNEARQALIDTTTLMYKKGHIITLMWHSCFPEDGQACDADSIWVWQPGVSEAKWDSLVTPGTELNVMWQEQVDQVAEFLKQLRDAGVPVLWRPYHEMNGIWFWWCNKRGDDGFVKLWRMMYDRFVNVHELHNLLWVWNPNAPRDKEGDEAYAYDLFFPGLEYVDILAADVYHNDYRSSHHDDLLDLAAGKLIALGEVGQLPTPEVLQEQPQWTWFMGWANWLFRANEPDSVRALYDAPRVLGMQDVERDADGRYHVRK